MLSSDGSNCEKENKPDNSETQLLVKGSNNRDERQLEGTGDSSVQPRTELAEVNTSAPVKFSADVAGKDLDESNCEKENKPDNFETQSLVKGSNNRDERQLEGTGDSP
eukprot:15064013-Ditylum_brightwellii.AAC.1